MTDEFDEILNAVRKKFAELCDSPRHTINSLPNAMPDAGIYLFYDDVQPLYVGRTNNLQKRLQYHTRNNHNQATFAFLLARHETRNLKASYQPKGSRKDLLSDPAFRLAFDQARARIRSMTVQWVEETDPIRQTILEVFTAFQTKAKYNDFDNH